MLINRSSYGGDSNSDALDHLTAIGVSTYPIASGDSISNALLNPIGGAQAGLARASVLAHAEAPIVDVSSDSTADPNDAELMSVFAPPPADDKQGGDK